MALYGVTYHARPYHSGFDQIKSEKVKFYSWHDLPCKREDFCYLWNGSIPWMYYSRIPI
jgi:hypothetical protein